MQPGTLETLEAELTRARAAVADLRRECEALAESTALVPDDEHDAEGSTIGFERARAAALLSSAERHLADLGAAAERARSGTYQRCGRCGGDIGAARLDALPATRLCVSCARDPSATGV